MCLIFHKEDTYKQTAHTRQDAINASARSRVCATSVVIKSEAGEWRHRRFRTKRVLIE